MDKETREFLDNKFGSMEQRFTAIDERFTGIDGKFEETKRYFGVLAGGLRSEIRQVAEGHQILVDGQTRIFEQIQQVERELGAMIKFSYAELDRRIRAVEEKMLA
jgi:hypothetical protein